MKKCLRAVLLVCGFLSVALFATRSAWAQATTGSIYGHVTDPSKSAVPGAKVTATNQGTDITYSSVTDQQGYYTVPDLPPASYTVTITKDGFDTSSISDVVIVVDQKQLLDFQMTVGAVNTVVTVTSAPTMLQTQNTSTGEVITTNDILDLPLLGRNFLSLTVLSAGVLPANGAVDQFSFAINGQRGYANSIMIDGVEATTNRSNDITVTPGVDSTQEFKITTSAYSAEFGRAAGGVVSIQTKSGTNTFHGDAFEFWRPNFVAAKPYSILAAPEVGSPLQQNNYGGTLGGPVVKNKSFFFVSFERSQQTDAYTYVDATPPMQYINVLPDGSVDLSKLVDPYGNPILIFNPYNPSEQFPGNVIPASMVSAAGLNTLLDFFPKPNLPGTYFGWYDNFSVYSPTSMSGNIGDARWDQEITSADRLSAVYHYGDSNQLVTDPYHGATVVPGAGDADQANKEILRNQELSVTETHVFNSRIVNEARFGYTRLRENLFSLLNGHDYSTEYGWGNIFEPGLPETEGYPYVYLGSGYLTGGSTYKPYLELDRNFQGADNVMITSVGKHDFKFGADFRRLNSNPSFPIFPTGFPYFCCEDYAATSGYGPPGSSTGSDIADLLVGIPFADYIGLQLTDPHTHAWEMHYYFQDVYKVTPRLTLNGGIRYEWQSPWAEAQDQMANYDPATDSLLLAGRGTNSATLINGRWNDFGPRFGLAYQITPKTVIRAGYGFFYSPENDAREDILTKNYPFATSNTYNNWPGFYEGNYGAPYLYQADIGIPRITTPPIPPGASSIPTVNTILAGQVQNAYYENPNIKSGYSQSYNLTLEREIGSSFTVSAAYVGSLSHDLGYKIGNINQVGSASNIVTPNLGQIQAYTSAGWGVFHSLQLKAEKRASRNLSFLAAYTYGHNIDNGPAPFDVGHVGNNTPEDPYDLHRETASADDDVRHTFVFSGLYRLPFGRGQKFLSNWGTVEEFLLGGWQLNGIFIARTGIPYNVIWNSYNTNCPGDRPDLVPGANIHTPTVPGTFFNTMAFQAPAGSLGPMGDPCALGDAGRNLLYGSGFVNADTSIFKDFRVKESWKVETRLEAFNVSNSPHFDNPNSDFGNPSNIGQITGTYGNMRILQLAAKFIF